MAALNREPYSRSLLKTYRSLGSSTHEASSYDDFDIRSETLILLGYDFHDDAHCDDLEEASDLSFSLAVTPSLSFGTVGNYPKGSLIVHDSSLPLAPLEELQEGDGFEIDDSCDDQCGIFVESRDSLFEEHPVDEPSIVDFGEVHLLRSLLIPFIWSPLLIWPPRCLFHLFLLPPRSSQFFRALQVYFC